MTTTSGEKKFSCAIIFSNYLKMHFYLVKLIPQMLMNRYVKLLVVSHTSLAINVFVMYVFKLRIFTRFIKIQEKCNNTFKRKCYSGKPIRNIWSKYIHTLIVRLSLRSIQTDIGSNLNILAFLFDYLFNKKQHLSDMT